MPQRFSSVIEAFLVTLLIHKNKMMRMKKMMLIMVMMMVMMVVMVMMLLVLKREKN